MFATSKNIAMEVLQISKILFTKAIFEITKPANAEFMTKLSFICKLINKFVNDNFVKGIFVLNFDTQ